MTIRVDCASDSQSSLDCSLKLIRPVKLDREVPMQTRFLLLLCALAGLSGVLKSQSSSGALIHRLEVGQTASGILIYGMFQWSPPMPPPQCSSETPHCFGGSNNPTGCQPLTFPLIQQCGPPDCHSTILIDNIKGGCNCLCTQISPPACTGCKRTGYCSGS